MPKTRSRTEKLWIGGGAAGVLVVAGVLWTSVVDPKLSEADSLRSQTSDTEIQNLSLQSKINGLQAADDKIASLRASLAQARAQLPGDSGMPALITQISTQARRTHVTVTTLTAGAASPAGAPAAGAAPAAPASPATPGSTAASAGGLFSIPVTVVVNGAPSAQLAFVDALEHAGPRATMVTSATVTGGPSGSSGGGSSSGSATGMTVVLQVFTAIAPAASTSSAPQPAA